MKRSELIEIKDFIYGVLQIMYHQDEFCIDDKLCNFENPMFDKAINYIVNTRGKRKR